MNVVSLIGRMTADPELKQTANGKSVIRFTLAVKRSYGDKTDFIRCEAWNKTAETMAKFLKKGDPVAITGSWQVDSMVGTDGKTTYYNTCSVDRFYFVPRVKSDAKDAVNGLKRRGIQTVMLTGDRKEVGEAVGAELGIDKVYAELLPGDKVDRIEEIFAEKKDGKKVGFVGDGINDAPVLARADVGIAMGGLGSEAAIEAADIVIMQDEPSKISKIIEISQNTMAIVNQ